MSALQVRLPRTPLGEHPLRRPSPWLAAAIALGAALGVAAATQQTAIAAGVALLPALVALLLYPDWLPVVLVVTVFGEAIATGSLTLSRLAGPLAVLVIIVALPGRSGLRLPRTGILWAVSAYSLWALASVLWTVNPDSGFSQGATGYALASLALSVAYMLAFMVFVRRERDVRRVVVAIWLLSSLAGLISIGQYASGYNRTLGLSGDANFFAALQVVALPIGALLANHVSRTRTRIVVLVGLAINVGSIITSLSRGGILALAAVFVLLSLQPARAFFRTRARKRAFVLVVAIGAGVLLAASYGSLSARTSSLFTTSDGGSGRTNLWLAALHGWHGHTLTGMGFGAFIGQSNRLLLQTPGVDFSAYALRPTGQVVHNAYLESLTELGVVGLVLFLALLTTMAVTLLWTARRAARAGAPFLSAFSRALLLSLAGFAFTSIFLSTETDRTLWVLLGLSLALPRVVLYERGRPAVLAEPAPASATVTASLPSGEQGMAPQEVPDD